MNCPQCKGQTTVFDTEQRVEKNITWRRRKCLVCGARFTTYEYVVLDEKKGIYTVDKKEGQK